MSEINLEQKIEEKENKKLTLGIKENQKEEKNNEIKKEENKNALEHINAKQEMDLSQKVDSRYTLREVLGIESGAKLIAVNSDSIENNKNTTRFSFIIKNKDGSLESVDMLNQVGGKTSNKIIHKINHDGSKVNEESVQSTFSIKSPVTRNKLITAKIGQMGNIEIGYGEMARGYNREVLTHEVETTQTYHTSARVREEFNDKKGLNNIKDDIEEIHEHEKYGCNDLTLDEADGDENTGHKHAIEYNKLSRENQNEIDNIIHEIKAENSQIEETFTDREIEERLLKILEKYPDKTLEEIKEKTQEELDFDSAHIHTREY